MEELRSGLEKSDNKLSENEMKALFSFADADHSGFISFNEFLTSTINVNTLVKDEEWLLKQIFNMFDTENKQKITAENLHYGFRKIGQSIPVTYA